MKHYALIVAGGKGERMGGDLPKQFLLLNGKPLLMHTITVFASVGGIDIKVVLPSSEVSRWESLCKEYDFHLPHEVIVGGNTRFHSVHNGLRSIGEEGVVAIHDGVRPLVTGEMIAHAYGVAAEKGNAVTAVKLKDLIREELSAGMSRHLDRDRFYLVQTPQVFDIALIRNAYLQADRDDFTDDAAVLEEAGGNICLVEGSYRNIKITTPSDLLMAEAMMNS